MKKLFSIVLFGAMLVIFSACEQKTNTTAEVYQVILVTDDLEGAATTISQTEDVQFTDEVRVTVTPMYSYTWKNEPNTTANNAICKSSTEKDGVYTYIFTSFEDDCVIEVIGIANPPAPPAPTTGTHENHDWVDLGLPSGTLWATCNVGATRAEEYGSHFAWGETTTKDRYDWDTYKYGNSPTTITKYCTESTWGTVDNKTILEPSDDAATVNWGGNWRTPTREELDELRTECTWTWTRLYGKYGYEVTGKNGVNLFLPAAGYRDSAGNGDMGEAGDYLSSSLYVGSSCHAWDFYFWNERYYTTGAYRYYGQSVRPVCSSL